MHSFNKNIRIFYPFNDFLRLLKKNMEFYDRNKNEF